jgi:hypothetical protein
MKPSMISQSISHCRVLEKSAGGKAVDYQHAKRKSKAGVINVRH